MAKPGIPKGTRDFAPAEVAKRTYIINTIKRNFEKYGYQPIETPSFENSETLLGKYGEEGDRLIFKILNSGNYLNSFNILRNDLSKIISYSKFCEIINYYIIHKKTFDNVNNDFNEFKGQVQVLLDLFKDKPSSLKPLNADFEGRIIKDDYIYSQLYSIIKTNSNNENLKETNDVSVSNLLNYKSIWDDEFLAEDLKYNILFHKFTNNIYEKYINYFTNKISEKALRYDLTVPFARYVVQHQNEIEFPFKRYQIQPVWRADKPQKGRFREFYQCDADVVGSKSLWQEVELVQLYDAVFTDLDLQGVTIKINNRKILSGIAEVIGASDKLIDFTVALDKLDKIGEDGVKAEMIAKGITEDAITKVQPLFNFTGTTTEKLEKLAQLLATSEEGMKGVEELRFITTNAQTLGLQTATLDLDVTLARGLNYYTGAIFEVAAPKEVKLGSIGGGGRYDDLTGIFGLKNVSGVGISFGLDRICLVVEELNKFPQTVTVTSKAMFLNFGDAEALHAMQTITTLRRAGIKVEMYPDAAKLDKQFKHAERRNIPFTVSAGKNEIEKGIFAVKDLTTGEKTELTYAELQEKLA